MVDGGGDRWLSFVDSLKNNSSHNFKVAELLTGDLDSISVGAKQRLCDMGTQIIPTPDQDETDFTKALKQVRESVEEVNAIVVRVV